jgi:hypothetical protein
MNWDLARFFLNIRYSIMHNIHWFSVYISINRHFKKERFK